MVLLICSLPKSNKKKKQQDHQIYSGRSQLELRRIKTENICFGVIHRLVNGDVLMSEMYDHIEMQFNFLSESMRIMQCILNV